MNFYRGNVTVTTHHEDGVWAGDIESAKGKIISAWKEEYGKCLEEWGYDPSDGIIHVRIDTLTQEDPYLDSILVEEHEDEDVGGVVF